MNLRHDVLAVHHDGCASRRPQRHVQHRAIFGDVDPVAAKHRIDSGAQPALLCKLDQQLQRLVVDSIFRIVQEDAGGLRRHAFAARRVICKQVSQVPALHCPMMILQRPPCRCARRACAGCLRSWGHLRHLLCCFKCVVASEARRAGCDFLPPKGENRRGMRCRCHPPWNAAERGELPDVASADHSFVGLERGDEACHDICNVAAPFLLAVALQSGPTHIVLIGGLLVGQVAKLHGLHDAVDNHCRSKPRSQPEEQHLAAAVASQGLHCSIVHDFDGTPECLCKVEAHPSASQVVGFGNRAATQHRPGIADRDHVVVPDSASFLTPETIRRGVNIGPDGNDSRSVCPVARILTDIPPTSTTSTFLGDDALAMRARSPRPIRRLAACRDFAFTTLTRPLEQGRFGADHAHQVVPRIDE